MKWQESEIRIMRKFQGKISWEKVAKKLKRSFYSVRAKAQRLRLFRFQVDNAYFSLTESEYAYIAGFFDGEGYTSFNQRQISMGRFYPSLILCFTNTNFEVMKWLRKKMSDKFYSPSLRKREPIGTNRKPIYQLEFLRKDAIEKILNKILPFLIVKKKSAKTVLLLIKGHNWNHAWTKREFSLFKRLRIENKRGLNHTSFRQPRGSLQV